MNQTIGDSKKQEVKGSVVYKEQEEKGNVQTPEGTAFETGILVKYAENPETSVEIKAGDVEMVRFTNKEDGIDAIYIPATGQVLLVDQKPVTEEQRRMIQEKYEAYLKANEQAKTGEDLEK